MYCTNIDFNILYQHVITITSILYANIYNILSYDRHGILRSFHTFSSTLDPRSSRIFATGAMENLGTTEPSGRPRWEAKTTALAPFSKTFLGHEGVTWGDMGLGYERYIKSVLGTKLSVKERGDAVVLVLRWRFQCYGSGEDL